MGLREVTPDGTGRGRWHISSGNEKTGTEGPRPPHVTVTGLLLTFFPKDVYTTTLPGDPRPPCQLGRNRAEAGQAETTNRDKQGPQSLEAARNQSPQWPHARTTGTDHMPRASIHHPGPRQAPGSWASPHLRAPRPSTPACPHTTPSPPLLQPCAHTVLRVSSALPAPSWPERPCMLPSSVIFFLRELQLLPHRHGSAGDSTIFLQPLTGCREASSTECSWSSSPAFHELAASHAT